MECSGQMLSYQIKISPVYVYSKWLSEREEEEDYNNDDNADDRNYILLLDNPESFRSEHFAEDIKKQKQNKKNPKQQKEFLHPLGS